MLPAAEAGAKILIDRSDVIVGRLQEEAAEFVGIVVVRVLVRFSWSFVQPLPTMDAAASMRKDV